MYCSKCGKIITENNKTTWTRSPIYYTPIHIDCCEIKKPVVAKKVIVKPIAVKKEKFSMLKKNGTIRDIKKEMASKFIVPWK